MSQNYIQEKYSYPLPNDGENYKFTKEELIKLLDSVYEKGLRDSNQNEGKVTNYTQTVIRCSRCGSEIPDGGIKYLVNMPTAFDGETESTFWCDDCYKSFMEDLSTPQPNLRQIKPAIIDPNVKEIIRKWTEKNIPVETYNEEDI